MGSAADNPTPTEPLPVHWSPPIAPAVTDNLTLARMVERMTEICPRSGAEALRELRAAFPTAPLAVRVAALSRLPY